jgi:ATP-dependent helicase/nuclease subunit A
LGILKNREQALTNQVLRKDTEIHFPHFSVLRASAGSGKTYTLTKRFVQFILSEKIPYNSMRNILAITFTNNAAKEMKEGILRWLKSAYFRDTAAVDELCRILSLDMEKLTGKAGMLIDEILANYPDFQVRTIDSFMTSIFKASAIDFGYNPDFDILISNDDLMEYSFDLFLRNVGEGTEEAKLLEEIVDLIVTNKKGEASFLWDPSNALLSEIKKIYKRLAATGKKPRIEDFHAEISELMDHLKTAIENIEKSIVKSGLGRRGNSSYITIYPSLKSGRFPDLIGKGLTNPPVNKPLKSQADSQAAYDRILTLWAEFGDMVRSYASFYVRTCYTPYLKVYQRFRDTIELTKKRMGKIFIEDVNRNLAEYLDNEIVPDVYFRLGDTIFHFLIDEFQDTSPIQWRNLFPLIENSLAQKGSAFVVGDTKQAIYGFRNADYTIMKSLESDNPFPSAKHIVQELGTNYRSLQKILEFNEKVFKDKVAASDIYAEAGGRSGLTSYMQRVKEGRDSPGYSEVITLERSEDPAERRKIQQLVKELTTRGYRFEDIAILTQKNEDAVRVSAWLNEKNIPFISYSSLDIRKRKITGEIISLLNFLDSPTDDLSFASFLLGDIFMKTLTRYSPGIDRDRIGEFLFTHKDGPPLYKSFQKEFVALWEKYFADIFRSTGFFPIYDLIVQIFGIFSVFEILQDEEASLVKILDVVKEFEGEGYNSLRDFLNFAGDGETGKSAWDIDVPRSLDAVKVMTVHKAKGLGFPVVIVLLYEDRHRGFDCILEENGEGVCLLKITKETSGISGLYESLYRKESIREMVNRLNSLYVAFTRPEEELYVVGVRGKKDGYPFDLLPADYKTSSEKPARVSAAARETSGRFVIQHSHQHLKFDTRSDEMMNTEEKRRGEFIHKVLSCVEYASRISGEEILQFIENTGRMTGDGYPVDGIRATVAGVMEHRELSEYFAEKPGRRVMTEQEFSDGDGNLFRMDRVVIDSNMITVIDFKTGKKPASDEKYERQMKTYMKILKGIYPSMNIRGIIAYADIGETRIIS